MTKQLYGKQAYRYASDELSHVNPQTRHYRAKLYGRLVLMYGKQGTDAKGDIDTGKTRYAIIHDLALDKNKSRYIRVLKELESVGLLSFRSNAVIIHTNLEIKADEPTGAAQRPEWIPERAATVFLEMDRLFGRHDVALYVDYGWYMLHYYLLHWRNYERGRAEWIEERLVSKVVRAAEGLSKNDDLEGVPLMSECDRLEYLHDLAADRIQESETRYESLVDELRVLAGGQQGVSTGGQQA